MPAEAKRVQPGIYLVFLGETITDDDIRSVMGRVRKAAAADEQEHYIVAVDTIDVSNPLRAARLFPQHHDPAISHYIFTTNSIAGQVMAERAAQKIADSLVEVSEHQHTALDRAKAIRGSADEPDLLGCDYLPD